MENSAYRDYLRKKIRVYIWIAVFGAMGFFLSTLILHQLRQAQKKVHRTHEHVRPGS